MIEPLTEKLLLNISREPFFKEHKAILIGGTALALNLNHRISFDLDICFPFAQELPKKLTFLNNTEKYNVQKEEFGNFIRDKATNEGGNIDYIVGRYTINDIKVDFLINPSENIYENQILKEDTGESYNNISIASVDTIFKLKALLLLSRNKIRDLFDVVYLLKEKNYTIEDFMDTFIEYRPSQPLSEVFDFISSKKANEFDIALEDVVNPQMEFNGYDDLKGYLVENIKKYLEIENKLEAGIYITKHNRSRFMQGINEGIISVENLGEIKKDNPHIVTVDYEFTIKEDTVIVSRDNKLILSECVKKEHLDFTKGTFREIVGVGKFPAYPIIKPEIKSTPEQKQTITPINLKPKYNS